MMFFQEFLKDLESLVTAFEKETSASGQRNIVNKIQHGLIAAQDIGDDKLANVQAMADIIENKSRQLENDSKNLDFGKDDDDEPNIPVSKSASTVTPSNVSLNKTSSANLTSTKGTKDKDTKESGAKGQIKRRNKKLHENRRNDDRDDDEVSTVSNRSGGSRSRGGNAGTGNKRQGVKRKAVGKRSSNIDRGDDSDREPDLSNLDIDPDEPRYCLCDQVRIIIMVFGLNFLILFCISSGIIW